VNWSVNGGYPCGCETWVVPIFESDDISINYQITGTGPRVLFFNGSGATLKGTELLLRSLSKECEVLAHDQRGLGLTSIPEGPYTMAQYAADAAALLDHVGWKTCVVIGMSFGGMVAQEFAVTFPERVERLALLCTSAGGSAGSSFPLHELSVLSTKERAEKMVTINDTRFTPEWLATHSADAQMINMFNDFAAIPKDSEVIRGEHLQLEARKYHDVVDRLHRIVAPTFIAAGKFDGLAPSVNSEAILELIPDATLSVYEGGHILLAQDPAAIREIRTFLATGVRPGSE
jgi:3-oxoadipate enol-lactonase